MTLEKILEQIPKEHLIKGRWYLGRGRTSNVGYWDGELFLTISYIPHLEQLPDGKVKVTQGSPLIKHEPYYDAHTGCFQPFLLINEGQMIEPFGQQSWDAHYGKKLLFKF